MYYMESYPMQNQMNSKKRRRLNSDETKILQAVFERNPKPDAMLRAALADRLGMTARNIQIWFQNKRAKTKKGKKDGSDDELISPTTAVDFSSVFTQEASPTEEVKSKAILPKVYYPSEMIFQQTTPMDFSPPPQPTAQTNQTNLNDNQISPSIEQSVDQSIDLFTEVTCSNDFDFLNFLEGEC